MLRRRNLIIGFIVLAVLVAGFFAFKANKLPFISQKQEIKTTAPKVEDISQILSASGEIKANQSVALRFQSSGLLTWVGVKEGDTVRKNQALASLDKRELQQNLKKELIDYSNERWDFEQTQADYKTTKDNALVTDSIKRILEKAQFDLNNVVIDVELKDLAIRLATLITPIAGVVTSIGSPYAGVNISPATAEFKVINPDTVYFSAEVDETDIAKVALNQAVNIALDAFPNEVFKGNVENISFSPVSGASGTVYEVKISLPEDKKSIFKLGFNGEAEIIIKEVKDALVLSPNVFTQLKSDGQAKVKILSNGQEKEVDVTLGIVTDDQAEILSGLQPNDQIILPISNGKKSK